MHISVLSTRSHETETRRRLRRSGGAGFAGAEAGMSLLEVGALEAGYDDALVLRGVSLTAHAHEIVAVIGPNGAGKSTLLKAVYGLVPRRSGSVRFADE